MLLKANKLVRPLYCTGYIGSTCIRRIQVDPGSALSIIPKRLFYFLNIPLSKLLTTTTTIYGFNIGSSHPLGNIRLQCQIRDLKSEVMCYVIDTDTSYNLLLGWLWIHANWIVPATLHQWFKYVCDDDIVWTVFAEMQPFKRVKNYFTDSLLYQESNKLVNKPLPIDNGNDADSESKEDALTTFIIELIIAYLDDSDCNKPNENGASWSLMKMSLLIIVYVLRIYLNRWHIVPCTRLCPSQKWHAYT